MVCNFGKASIFYTVKQNNSNVTVIVIRDEQKAEKFKLSVRSFQIYVFFMNTSEKKNQTTLNFIEIHSV